MTRFTLIPFVLAMVAGIGLRGDLHSHGWWDFIAFLVFCVFFWWLLPPLGERVASGGKEPNKSVAFRSGKALKRIWRGRGR